MFACEAIADGIYSFRLVQDQIDFIQIKDTDRLFNPVQFLSMAKAQQYIWEQQADSDSSDLASNLKSTVDRFREDCLLLLGECTSVLCPCNRASGTVSRDIIEMCVEDLINNVINVVSIGPGGMHQDLRILLQRNPDVGEVNYYILDSFKDFFEMIPAQGVINPYDYTGPDDAQASKRSQWFASKCMLYGTFLKVLSTTNIKVNLYLCKSPDQCVKHLSQSSSTLVLGIDILDDYAVITLPVFMSIASAIPCTAVLIAAGYWDIFISKPPGEKVTISTGNNDFGLYSPVILYKLNSRIRKSINKIGWIGLGIVGVGLGVGLGLGILKTLK